MKLAYSTGTVGVSMVPNNKKDKKTKENSKKSTLKLAKAGYCFTCCQNEY